MLHAQVALRASPASAASWQVCCDGDIVEGVEGVANRCAARQGKGTPHILLGVGMVGRPFGYNPKYERCAAGTRSPAERALSVRVLGFGCGADYLEGPVSSTPPEHAPPQARARL